MFYIITIIIAAFIGGLALGLMAMILTSFKGPKVVDHSIYMETITIENDDICTDYDGYFI